MTSLCCRSRPSWGMALRRCSRWRWGSSLVCSDTARVRADGIRHPRSARSWTTPFSLPLTLSPCGMLIVWPTPKRSHLGEREGRRRRTCVLSRGERKGKRWDYDSAVAPNRGLILFQTAGQHDACLGNRYDCSLFRK